ncbi:hypothetical protein PBCVNW6652_775L [Paramecium bursaria Chlorella virus NW665.2]|nr:hypothetical protein PBCVNW6652_775L [Paramecium bursaria Chlorella virus NW665.2]
MSYQVKPLVYYAEDGKCIEFTHHTIDTDYRIFNTKMGRYKTYTKKSLYNLCDINEDGKSIEIRVARAMLSTFVGPPPDVSYSADHIESKQKKNDCLDNLRWSSKKRQVENRNFPNALKSAFLIVKDGVAKTAKEWELFLEGQSKNNGNAYKASDIKKYAQRGTNGFSYETYDDLEGEIWKFVEGSKMPRSYVEISNKNRIKRITPITTHVYGIDNMSFSNGYPVLSLGGKKSVGLHVIAFKTFFPEEYNKKNPEEMVLHINDNKNDFRPENLRLGTASKNTKDAYDNGKYDGTKRGKQKCASYIDGKLEKIHESQSEAMRYMRSIGYDKAYVSGINAALNAFREGKVVSRYDRTWELVCA